jgi:CrcB protein
VSAWAWCGVFVLGGAGAFARFCVDVVVSGRLGRDLPLGTLVVNLSGSLLLGLLTGLALDHDAAVLAGTATVGSYTTFSTWLFETQRLGEDGRHHAMAANVAVSLVLGVAGAALGRTIGAHL